MSFTGPGSNAVPSRPRPRSGGFHCRTAHACALMVAQRTAFTHYPACSPLVCSLIQNTCAEGQKETTTLKWLNGKCVVAIKTLQTTTNCPSTVFGDTRLALTKWANRMRLGPVYMHLCSLIGYELSSDSGPDRFISVKLLFLLSTQH